MNKEAKHLQPRGKILFSFLLVAVSIILIAAGLYRVYCSSRLNQQLANLRSRGIPTNFEELNAWYAVPPGVRDTTTQWTAATRASKNTKISSGAKGVPLVGDGPVTVPPPGEEWAELEASRSFLKETDRELQLIIAAAIAGGMARYPVDFRKGFDAAETDQHQTRVLARLLSLSAHVHAHDGHPQRVLKDVKGIFAVSGSLSGEPRLIAQVVCNSIHAMGCVQAVQMLPHCQWLDKELQELQLAVAQAVFRKNLQRAFYGELAIVLESLETPPSPSIFSIVVTRDNSRSRVIALMDSTARAMDLSWTETVRCFNPTAMEMMATEIDPLSPVSHIIVSLGLPALQRVLVSGMRTEARQHVSIAIIAAQRYRLKHGTLPRKLNELRDFVPGDDTAKRSRLIDPFDGEPLRIKTSDNGLIIYSISENGIDDGGDVDNAVRVSADLGDFISD